MIINFTNNYVISALMRRNGYSFCRQYKVEMIIIDWCREIIHYYRFVLFWSNIIIFCIATDLRFAVNRLDAFKTFRWLNNLHVVHRHFVSYLLFFFFYNQWLFIENVLHRNRPGQLKRRAKINIFVIKLYSYRNR